MHISRHRMHRAAVAALSLVVGGFCLDAQADVVYSTYSDYTTPSNRVSQAYEATSTYEFGDHIALGAGSRNLQSVTVTLSDWALASANNSTAAGYNQMLTLNLYNYTGNTATDRFASSTVDAFVPFRPEPTANCATDNNDPKGYGPDCSHGVLFDVTFDFGNVALPDELVYGLAFSTRDYGPNATHTSGPADSLNFAFAADPTPSAGTDVDPDSLFIAAASAYPYTDESASDADGTPGSFNEDGGWSGFTPTVRFVTADAVAVPEPSTVALFAIAGAGLLLGRRRRTTR